MDNIKDIVTQVIEKTVQKKSSAHEELETIWGKLHDKKTLEHVKIVGLKNGCLLVDVDSPARLYELNSKKRKLVENLNKRIPEIKDIYLRVGMVK